MKNLKKNLIIIITALLLLAGCSGKTGDSNTTDVGGSESQDITVTTGEEKEEETIAVIPPIPEEGLPEIPDSEVKYSDEILVIQVDTDGTTYANGQVVESDKVIPLIQQAASEQLNSKTEESSTKGEDKPIIPDIVTTDYDEDVTALPGFEQETETERPITSIFIDDTIDKDDKNDGDKENDKNITYLAKYVSTGDTDLDIKDIKVYSSAKPGISGVDSFKSGDTMLVNLWCNTVAALDSYLYIVPEGAEHKDSYKPIEYMLSYDLFSAFEAGEGQLVFEIELPDNIHSGVFELRFVCGTEEGYIPFHMGS